MDGSLENLHRLEVYTGGCLVPPGLVTATIKAIDGALRQLGPLCEHPVQEEFEVPTLGSESPVGGEKADVAECDTPIRSKSPLKNATLSYDEYIEALVDDTQAEKDRVMLAEKITRHNMAAQSDIMFRMLDRHDMGLKPAPKQKLKRQNAEFFGDGEDKPPLPRKKVARSGGAASSSVGVSKSKKGKVKKDGILVNETIKKQLHSATQLKLPIFGQSD